MSKSIIFILSMSSSEFLNLSVGPSVCHHIPYSHFVFAYRTNDFDVALIKLIEPIDFLKYREGPYVAPACIADLGPYDHSKLENTPAIVAGWGLNASNAAITMATLQKLDVTVFKDEYCKTAFTDRFSARMMCAGYKEGGKDSCQVQANIFNRRLF